MDSRTKIVFMGTPQFAVPSLQALIDMPGIQIDLVLTQPDRPKGRGQHVQASPVKQLALQHNIPVLTPGRLNDPGVREQLEAYKPNIAIVAAYGLILPTWALQWPKLGCINVHASILPKHRGASPITQAILDGDKNTGISIMQLEAGLDTGPVFASAAIPIGAETTTGQLEITLAQLGADLLQQTLSDILKGRIHATPQNHSLATYAHKIKKQDGALDFSQSAAQLERQIRAYHPWPGCFTFLGTERIVVLDGYVVDQHPNSSPGTIIEASSEADLLVACGNGCLRISRIKPEGKREMDVGAWLLGRHVGDLAMFSGHPA